MTTYKPPSYAAEMAFVMARHADAVQLAQTGATTPYATELALQRCFQLEKCAKAMATELRRQLIEQKETA